MASVMVVCNLFLCNSYGNFGLFSDYLAILREFRTCGGCRCAGGVQNVDGHPKVNAIEDFVGGPTCCG